MLGRTSHRFTTLLAAARLGGAVLPAVPPAPPLCDTIFNGDQVWVAGTSEAAWIRGASSI